MLSISQEHSSGVLDAALSVFSLVGSVEVTGATLLVLLAVLFLRGRRVLAGRLLAVFVATGILELAIKLCLPHVQPPQSLGHAEYFAVPDIITTKYSYPSRHMLRGVILLGALYYLLKSRFWRAGVILMLLGLAASRIYFETHWASDVVGGALLGTLALFGRSAGKRGR